jgi:hypothetical protein
MGKHFGALTFDFGDQKELYYVLPRDQFRQMLEAWEEVNGFSEG